ncbi:MAG: WD40-repeat-containing domain protein [Benjaminiella poitrasii]|nr:MAG: WD40-repeat-containing domain protein [Benjaminiella poitrasii]
MSSKSKVGEKRSSSLITKYFKSNITTTTKSADALDPPSSTKQQKSPLTSVDDNTTKSSPDYTLRKKEKEFARYFNQIDKTLDSSPTTTTNITTNNPRSSSTSSSLVRPTLKRSHSTASSHLDSLNKDWLNTPITNKQKTYDNTNAYDRLIPSVTDMASAQALINSSQKTTMPDSEDSFDEQIAKAIGIDASKRILSFTVQPPTKTVNLQKNAPLTTSATHSSSSSSSSSNTRPARPKRRILMTPERILDAPYIVDDYYLNVLDWSKNNVVAIGMDKSVYLWNADTGSIQALNYRRDEQVCSLSWSFDGCYLAVGTESGMTQIWDVQRNACSRMMGHNSSKRQMGRISSLDWDRHHCSSGAYDGSIFHHDVRIKDDVVQRWYGHEEEVCGLKWRWDGGALASGGNDNTVNIWDARVSQARHTMRSHTGAIKALAWCPWKYNLLATGGGRDDQRICFWNATTGSCVKTIKTGAQVTSLNWSQHHHEIASTHGGPKHQIAVWDYPTSEKVVEIPAHSSRILHAVLSPDGQTLATAAADENLKFWRLFESEGRSRLGSQRQSQKQEFLLRKQKSLR